MEKYCHLLINNKIALKSSVIITTQLLENYRELGKKTALGLENWYIGGIQHTAEYLQRMVENMTTITRPFGDSNLRRAFANIQKKAEIEKKRLQEYDNRKERFI